MGVGVGVGVGVAVSQETSQQTFDFSGSQINPVSHWLVLEQSAPQVPGAGGGAMVNVRVQTDCTAAAAFLGALGAMGSFLRPNIKAAVVMEIIAKIKRT